MTGVPLGDIIQYKMQKVPVISGRFVPGPLGGASNSGS
jgi:hypothetical protein